MRVAADGDDIYIDVDDPDWHAVESRGRDWSIVQSPQCDSDVATERAVTVSGPGAPIDPTAHAPQSSNANEFRARGRVPARCIAACVARIRCHAIGEHGTAKTTFVRMLRN